MINVPVEFAIDALQARYDEVNSEKDLSTLLNTGEVKKGRVL